MPTTFITGATGFLGGHLVRRLYRLGHKVRALVRPNSCHNALASLPVELVFGDLSKFSVIREAMRGCDFVYHTAADYRLWTPRPAEMYASNVEGTRNVLQAAWEMGVGKIVYTSTVGTIGLDKQHCPADETTFLQINSKTGHYKKSKFWAEEEAIRFARRGLPVVIVNPSAPVGSHDWKPTPTGRIIQDFLNGRMPMYLDTGLDLVDVEDVAEGHLLAAQKGRSGERYILGNENLTLKQILTLLSEITGLSAPRICCPYALAMVTSWFSEGAAWLLGGKDPRVPREGVHMARYYMFFDSRKAREELGYAPGSVRLALQKAVQWFSENGYVRKSLALPFTPFVWDESPLAGSMMPIEGGAVAMAE